MDGSARRPNVYADPDNPLCPLCGVDLGIPPRPQMPCMTLDRLARHFSDDCPATLRLGQAMAADAPHASAPRDRTLRA